MKSKLPFCILLLWTCLCLSRVTAQTFVHPGGLHTRADLDRMKAKVAAGEQPWLEGWNKLIADSQAQNTYTPAARANMGSSRQRADADAHAAYLNALRWYVTGDSTYAECAVRICNAWSGAVNQVPTGTDIPGLSGIPVFDFALAAEVLRIYPGWAPADFERFKNMMRTYFYPVCHDFLVNHNGACIDYYWANWDIANTGALIAMGVLCDDPAIYNEGVEYFKNGGGAGSIKNAVYYLHPGNMGQWQESGRDQEHAQLGVGMMASLCQVAWNQGLDLFGYDNNRLLAGAEYVARTNLSLPVPYITYNNCVNVNQKWLSINGIGRMDDRPVWELIYNHYVVRKGLDAPNVKAMAHLTRPEYGSIDHFGYGTFTFTLDQVASPYPPFPVPAAPAGLTATAGNSRVDLNWTPGASDVQGYKVLRATAPGGPYTTLASWDRNTYPQYVDGSVTNGTTYYYVIAANNQSGTGSQSMEVTATPVAVSASLPTGWARQDVGNTGQVGTASYAAVAGNTFITSGAGAIGATSDGLGFTYGIASGDVTITARMIGMGGTNGKTGIMIRESLAADAKAFLVKRGDVGWRQAGFGARAATGGTMSWTAGNDYTWIPAWFRLRRSGNTITAFESGDGLTWFEIGSAIAQMGNNCYVGLFNSSGNTTSLSTATFDNVTITSSNAALAAPQNVTANPGNTRNTVSWEPVTGASAYTLKRATVSGGPYSVIASNLSATSYADTNLTNGTTYYYIVTAANLAVESPNSSEASATPVLALPSAPTAVTARSVSLARTKLSWTASLSAESYRIKRATVSGGPYTIIGTAPTSPFTDSTLTDTATYYYVVSAVNAIGESANSAVAYAAPGKISYWKFDENSGSNAADAWGDRSGTLGSGAARISGISGQGVQLNGTNSGYVALPSDLTSGVTNFTIATWVKAETTTAWMRIFDFGSGTGSYMFLTPASSNNTVRYAIKSGSTELQINRAGALSTGVWHHIAITQSGSLAILYIDGVEAGRNATMTLNPASLGNTTQNWIGRSQFSTDPYLNGSVDEFRIYSRALTASEIVAMVPPLAPANLTATAGNNRTALVWSSAARADSYRVKRAEGGGTDYITLATVSETAYIDSTAANCVKYNYVVTAVNQVGESGASTPANVLQGNKLTGTLIGTAGSWNNNAATTKAAAVDGNLNTYFDAAQANGNWVGFDLGANGAAVIREVRYAPRNGYASRMIGGVFQGANNADFSDAAALFTVTSAPAVGVWTVQSISDARAFRYLRYLAPNGSNGNVAEIEFKGLSAAVPVITSAKTLQITADSTFRYVIEASNLPSGYSLTGLPAGLVADSCRGVITGTPTATGTFRVSVRIPNYFGTATDTLLFNVRRNQTLQFPALPSKRPGDVAFAAGAVASSGLAVSYVVTDTTIATVVDGKIHPKLAGSTTITASQPGNTDYNAAAPVSRTFTVLPLRLEVQYQDGDKKQTANNTIKPYLKLVNKDSVAISYQELTVRYWFTAENYSGINTWIDYAALGIGKVNATYNALPHPRTGAFGYLGYGFTSNAGNLGANSDSGPIQSRAANLNWALLDETDDYSYQNSEQYAANAKITLYRNGVLIWGSEPEAVTPVKAVKVYAQNPDIQPASNALRNYLKVVNEGNEPVAYGDLSMRYWFTKDSGSPLNFWIDYAALGNSKLSGQFTAVDPQRENADTYLDLKIDPSAGILYPRSNTGQIQFRVTKSDWSSFTKTNDYSFQPYAQDFAENNRITVYYKGTLIYGTEPGAASANARTASVEAGEADLPGISLIYPNPVSDKVLYIRKGGKTSNSSRVHLIDISGRTIYDQSVQGFSGNLFRIELPARVEPGIYLLRVGEEPVQKIVVR